MKYLFILSFFIISIFDAMAQSPSNFSLGFAYLITAQSYEKKIDSLIQKAIRLNRFNGSVLVCKNGKVVYEKTFGYQDASKKELNTSNTVYQIGSTTKEFTAGVINTNYQVKVTRTGNQLFLQRNSQPTIPIYAYRKDSFFQKDGDIRIAFKNENGQATKITITEGLSTKRGD